MKLRLGFSDGVDSWEIRLVKLKESIASHPDRDRLRELFSTYEGRQRLAESINNGQPLL